ncbi:MAG: phosphatase PAP2 family protein, partial [Spirochaetales bacterium]|nr:phosphatase PAP2 family protein [Spirochaetales bacterium]
MKKKLFVFISIALLALSFISAASINDISKVNGFDRMAMNPYSKPLDDTATVLNYISLASPALLAINRSSEDITTLGVMYLETMAGAYASKEILKKVIDRPRPYTYFDGAPEEEIDDWNNSFPSGHTTLSFASAGFISYVFSHYYPDSKWKAPVIAAS